MEVHSFRVERRTTLGLSRRVSPADKYRQTDRQPERGWPLAF